MIEWEVIKRYGEFRPRRDGSRGEVNSISYDKREPVIDIRVWRGERMLKGLTIKPEELQDLIDLLIAVTEDYANGQG